jgi:hypothetical protein
LNMIKSSKGRNLNALVCIEPQGVSTTQSGVNADPLDQLTSVLVQYEIFSVYKLNIIFLLAFTRAGFDSQLTLNCLGPFFRGKGLLAVKVQPIQSVREYY